MKIVVVGTRGFPDVQGGVEKHCEKLYTHLAQKGCEVIVFTRKPYISHCENDYRGVTLIPVDCPRNKFLEAFVHTFLCVFKSWKIKPDLLHIHAIGPSLFAPLARLMGMKVVVTNHGPDYMRKKWNLFAKIFLRSCERIGIKFANEIIAISRDIAVQIKTKYKREATVIPNGVEIGKTINSSDALRRFGLQKEKYILAVGRFVPEKGFHDLIDAFCDIDSNDLKLVIAGDADHEDQYSLGIKAKADKHKNIVLAGFLEEHPLNELYSHAALFVLSSSYEGLPIALLEAMSFGVSCIASDIPANRNIELDDSRYFKLGDIKSLTSKIIEFMSKNWTMEDKDKQIHMLEEIYNWDKIAENTLHVYEKVIS